MATITANTGSNNWNTNGAWVGSVQPSAADNVIIPASATVTIPASTTVQARSVTVQTSGSVIQVSTGTILNIGDGTAGAGNVALSIAGSWSSSGTNGNITFLSTSATQQTITTGGNTINNTIINGTGSYILGDALTSSGKVTITKGTFNSGNYNITCTSVDSNNTNTRTITMGSSTITCTANTEGWTFTTITGLTWTTCTANVNLTGINSSTRSGTFTYTGLAVNFVGGSSMVGNRGGGIPTYDTITVTGKAAKTDIFTIANTTSAAPIITNAFTITGDSVTNRILLQSGNAGTQVQITAGSISASNLDVKDIQSGGASAPWNLASITGNSGDCGGNSGITFTTPATQTATGTASFSWSTHGWTSRVPLPQDDVIVGNAFVAGRTVTMDMPRLGKSIDFSGSTGAPTITASGSANEIYGSWAFAANNVSSGTPTLTFAGRSTHTITSAGVLFTQQLAWAAATGIYGLNDDVSSTRTATAFTMGSGTLNTNNFNLTATSTISGAGFNQSGGTINPGTSTFHIADTVVGTVWNCTAGTFNGGNETIVIDNASTSARTFAGNNNVYGTLQYNVTGSTGQLIITSGFINKLLFSDSSNARTLSFSSNTVTINDWSGVFGTASNNILIGSSVGGTQRTIDCNALTVQSISYATITDLKVQTPYALFATNSSDGGNNVNWTFSAAPAAPYIRQSNFLSNTAATSATNTFAYTTSSGQMLLWAMGTAADPGTITPPSGWLLAKQKYAGSSSQVVLYYKISDGTETSVTFNWVNSVTSNTMMFGIGGFLGTPTLDTSESNSSASATSLSSGSGATNSAYPAFSFVAMAGNGSMGASSATLPTNSYQESYNTLQTTGSLLKIAVLPLTTSASRSTTLTWQTSRVPESVLVNFIDVPTVSNNGNFFMFM